MQRTGKLIIFTAPSGAGKTTIVRHLLKCYPNLAFSVSATSRERRPNEKEGVDYYFLSIEEFKKKIKEEAFIEWEEVYDNQFYGTLKSEVDRLLEEGKNVIFDIDVEGATNLKKRYKDHALAIFVKPPSELTLLERLQNRKTETRESLRKRIEKAKRELAYQSRFDQILVNDVLEETFSKAEAMVETFTGVKKGEE
ncbi:MAG: guanylate kinase [Saprospiraceae bacterium]|nr:guanylate kinase [Saprospiraceae bacterium]